MTRLDFDSCVAHSPDACRQYRARVTRDVINVDSGDSLLHHPEVIVSEHDRGQISRDAVVASNVTLHVDMKEEDSDLLICSDRTFSKNLVHNFNKTEREISLEMSPDHISGTQNANSVTESSPIIGKKHLFPGERYFYNRKSWRKKRRRKVDDSLQPSDLCQEHTASPSVDFHKSGRNSPCQLNKETEVEFDSKNNVNLTVDTDFSHIIGENEMSPVVAPQQNRSSQRSVVSPIMKCHRRLRKQKHSVKVSHLGKNCLHFTSISDQGIVQVNDIGLKEGESTENLSTPSLITSHSSPVLGKSIEKRFRRRKCMKAVKSEDHVQNKKDCCSVSRKGSLLRAHSIEDTPQQRHMQFMFNNINDCITLEEDRKTEIGDGLKEDQNCMKCDASGVDIKNYCVINEDGKVLMEPECSDEETGFALSLADAETAEKCCDVTDNGRKSNSPSLEFVKIHDGNGQCGRNSVDETKALFPNVLNNVPCTRKSLLSKNRENMCNSRGKEEGSDGLTSSELLIETETSLDISRAADCHNDLPQVNSCH